MEPLPAIVICHLGTSFPFFAKLVPKSPAWVNHAFYTAFIPNRQNLWVNKVRESKEGQRNELTRPLRGAAKEQALELR